MCLSLKSANTRKKFALWNKVVYKHLDVYECDDKTIMITPYQRFEMKIGSTYKAELCRYCNDIYDGLHSFKHIKDCESNYLKIWGLSKIHIGLKTYYHKSSVIVKCVIPAGSWYYKGMFSGYKSLASNRLKIVEIIKEL